MRGGNVRLPHTQLYMCLSAAVQTSLDSRQQRAVCDDGAIFTVPRLYTHDCTEPKATTKFALKSNILAT